MFSVRGANGLHPPGRADSRLDVSLDSTESGMMREDLGTPGGQPLVGHATIPEE